jgi:hypothetical protein
MKSASIIPKTFIGLCLLFSISAPGQTNKDKIQGTWKVYKYELKKPSSVSDELMNKIEGTIFRFDNCLLTISKKENGINDSKSGTYSLTGNKLTLGVDQPEAEIILLNDTQLNIKLPHNQGILYFSKS